MEQRFIGLDRQHQLLHRLAKRLTQGARAFAGVRVQTTEQQFGQRPRQIGRADQKPVGSGAAVGVKAFGQTQGGGRDLVGVGGRVGHVVAQAVRATAHRIKTEQPISRPAQSGAIGSQIDDVILGPRGLATHMKNYRLVEGNHLKARNLNFLINPKTMWRLLG